MPFPPGRESDGESDFSPANASGGRTAESADALPPGPFGPLSPIERKLLLIDRSLNVLAVMLLIYLLARWRRGRPVVMPSFPERRHTFAEDSVLLPVLVFLFTSVALSTVLTQLGFATDDALYLAGAGSGAQLAGLLACLVIAAKQFEGGVPTFVLGSSEQRNGDTVRLTIVVAILAIGLCPALLELTAQLLHWLMPDYEFAPHATMAALERSDVGSLELMLLWSGAAVVAPIAEETFFRGVAQTWLGKRLGRTWLAILLTSVLFGLVHANVAYTIPPLIVLGLMLGWLYEKTGALWTVILVHALFNLKTLVWDALIRHGATALAPGG